MESQWPIPTPRKSSKKAISLAESRANPTSCPARLLERIAPLHARSGGVKAGGVQTAAAESYRLYLPHWNRFRKPRPTARLKRVRWPNISRCENFPRDRVALRQVSPPAVIRPTP